MKINSILNKIKQPFINVEYYKESINKSFLSSFGILSTVILIMAFLSGSKFTRNEVPKFIETSTNTVSEFSDNYPEDLTFNWNGQKLMSNTEEISVPWPSSFTDESKKIAGFPDQFLYFSNSNQAPSQLNISTNEYMIVVNSSNLYHINDSNPAEWTEQPLETVLQLDATQNINKDSVTFFSNQTLNFINSNVNQIKIVFFTAFSLLFYFSKFWFLVIESILVVLLFKLYALKLTTKQTILLTTHVMIPTVVLNTVAELLYENINFPLQTLTFWILVMFISFQFRKNVKKV